MQTKPRPWWWTDYALLAYLAFAKVLLHFLTNGRYGYFRDELYYIACSEHLDWGYVDHPPLSIAILWLSRALFGDSIFAIRLPAVLAGAAVVVLTGVLARHFGGRRFATWAAALACLGAGPSLVMSTFFSMNIFDLLFWLLCALLVARLVNEGNVRLWVVFGVVAGLALLNKISIAFFAVGIVVGLLLTPQRRVLLNRWVWVGGAIAGVLFLPHVVWQVANGFPTLEFMDTARSEKIVAMSPLEFLGAQVVQNNPFSSPVWIVGLAALLFAPALRPYRLFGIAYLTMLVVFIVQGGKPYYLSPAYPVLFAAGGVAFERFWERKRWPFVQPAVAVWLVVSAVLVLPIAVPVLSPAGLVRYMAAIGIEPPREERTAVGALPQHFSDRFGWENLVATIARVYEQLPEDERRRAAIFTENYGEAGAVDFFGRRYGLPGAMSGHNNYWLWGRGAAISDVVIVVGVRREDLEEVFEDVRLAATVVSPNARPSQNNALVHVCRGPKMSLSDAWEGLKRFI